MLCVLGYVVTNRFRELERPQTGRLKDVVLMATVTGFESLRIPSRSDMKQFAELFEPLFLGSSNEARRQAAAALSQCPHVPEPVALLIGSMPISIAAAFLARATAISDGVLISIIRQQGPGHANAIARRENLSPSVIDVLVEHHQSAPLPARLHDGASRPVASDPQTAAAAVDREEKLRAEIKALARVGTQEKNGTLPIQPSASCIARCSSVLRAMAKRRASPRPWQTRSEQAAHSPTVYCSMFPASNSPRRSQLSPSRRTRKAACSRGSIPTFPKESAAATAPKH